MCGLFGCITKRDFELSKGQADTRNSIIKGLAIAMEHRGGHSTGVAGIDSKWYSLKKEALPAQEFIETPKFNGVLKYNHNIIIGHTRLATIGEVNDKNAHPFKFGNIIGAHNGHVSNYYDISKDIEVDSEAIFYLLDKYKNDYKKAFKELYGSFAVTWFDITQPNKIHFVVDGNPLNLIYINEIKTYFYASEEYPLQGVVGSYFDLPKQKTWKPESSKVYTITTNLQVSKKDVEFSKTWPYKGSSYSYPSYHNHDNEHEDLEEWFRDREEIEEYNKSFGYSDNYGEHHTPTYEERNGVKNPYKVMEEEEAKEKDAISKLDVDDMVYIRERIEDKGCDFGKHNIDIISDDGFYWYKMGEGRHVICCECVESGDYGVRRSNLVFVEPEDYTEMMNELEVMEEAEKEIDLKN